MKFKKIISSSLAIGLIFNNASMSLASVLSEDGRYETFEGSNITIDNVLEEDKVDIEIEGNTMVNYAQDGSKELILNGDIDLEGTSVTTTEGVDGGLVDVEIEGDTLVNLQDNSLGWTVQSNGMVINNNVSIANKLKPSTQYTVIIYDSNSSVKLKRIYLAGTTKAGLINVFITPTDLESANRYLHLYTDEPIDSEYMSRVKAVVIEGDWTNKEIPPYFEGMKSIGQDDENGHKVEIFSANGKTNLFKNSGFLNGGANYNTHNGATYEVVDDNSAFSKKAFKFTTGATGLSGIYQYQIVPCIEDVKYTISGWCKGEVGTTLEVSIERHSRININFTNEEWVRFEITSETNPLNWNRTITFYSADNNKVFYLKDIKAEKSDFATPYIPHVTESHYSSFMNSKEILLNEPLRGLPNGVKDRFVKKDGKWYIERNCAEVTLDGSETWYYHSYTNDDYLFIHAEVYNERLVQSDIVSNKFPTYYDAAEKLRNEKSEYIWYGNSHKDTAWIYINKDRLFQYGVSNGDTSIEWVKSFKQWLSDNPITVVYQLETPIYEELEIEPTLNTYSNMTHISNNSIIPANMKVQNTGYDCILKPNTEYTIAVDKKNWGMVGVNLGGAKAETNSDTLVLTTPDILRDNVLRVYGKASYEKKDIKISNIRVLEGDKTDNIPAYFEGIQSSFENSVQVDNSYEMEILSNNKNLVDLSKVTKIEDGKNIVKVEDNKLITKGWAVKRNELIFNLKPNTKYRVTGKVKVLETPSGNFYDKQNRMYLTNDIGSTFTIYAINIDESIQEGDIFNINNEIITPANYRTFNSTYYYSFGADNNGIAELSDFMITEIGDESYVQHQSNKTVIPLTEPLRSLPNGVKDRIVKRNGQWVIERNLTSLVLDGSDDENWSATSFNFKTPIYTWNYTGINIVRNSSYSSVLSDRFAYETRYSETAENHKCLYVYNENKYEEQAIRIQYPIDTLERFREWLSNNPISVIIQLEEPVYEPIKEALSVQLFEDVTHISNSSTIPANMKVIINRTINRATEAIELFKINPTTENLSRARMWVNLLDESIKKDELQSEINSITNLDDMILERKTATANLDVYVMCENMLSMSLNTNNITFDNYSGVEDVEKPNALEISINSSLPYDLNAYLQSEIKGSENSNIMDMDILKIKDNSKDNYQSFANTIDKVVLDEDCSSGNYISHNIDLKLESSNAYSVDVYKTTIKFEAVQK